VGDSQIRKPNHTIVNRLATGGNQAAKDISPVDAASTSTASFVSLVMVMSLYCGYNKG